MKNYILKVTIEILLKCVTFVFNRFSNKDVCCFEQSCWESGIKKCRDTLDFI